MGRIIQENDPGEFLFKEETYQIIGICMTVHQTLGHGFSEIVYKDAVELELTEKKIEFERSKLEYRRLIY